MKIKEIQCPRCGHIMEKDIDEMADDAEENVAFVGCDCGEEEDRFTISIINYENSYYFRRGSVKN